MESDNIDIVIVNWNSGSLLYDCIVSIKKSSQQDLLHAIIVVDNASADVSLDMLPQYDKLMIIQNQENLGFAKAANQGFRLSTASYTLLLNPDTRLFPDTLQKCGQFMEEHQDVDILGVRHLKNDGSVSPSCARFPTPLTYFYDAVGLSRFSPRIFTPALLMTDWDHLSDRVVDQVIGAFMFMRNSIFQKIGYFDEQFFVYCEELDFSKRLVEAGGKSFYTASIKIVHIGGGTTKKVMGYRLFLNLRSRMLYGKKHFTTIGYFGLLITTLVVEPVTRILFNLFKGDFKEVREIFRGYWMLAKDRAKR